MNTYRDPGALMPASDPTSAPAPPPPPQSDREMGHGHIGLVNQGCTCYLSSMLQFLFHIGYFRSAVYATSIADEDPSPIPRALQALFFQMQERQTTGTTVGLTNSFGWGDSDLYVQHDIHEMVTKLREVLEEKMKGTPSEGAINRLFEGKGENVIETMDGTYTSRRPETFYDIILAVTDYRDLYSSLASHCEKTQLVGDCKYKVEVEGEEPVYKDAEKGYRFVRFPPVMCFHLKRFEMDMFSPDLETKKVNSHFGFPEVLDLSEFEVGEDEQHAAPPTPSKMAESADASPSSVPLASASDFSKPTAPIYDLHSVIVHKGGYGSGHYYCYVRMFDMAKPKDEPASQKAEDEEGAESAVEGVTAPYTGGQWFEFDDERVRMVKTPVATTENFGGERASYGRGGGASAYVLVYLRRGFLPELLMEASPDSIPQRAKDELRRVMLEDERIAIDAAEAKRKVSITLVDDNHIYEHVRTNTTDLIRGRYDDLGKDSGDGAYTKRVHSSGSATHPPGIPRGVAYNHLKIDKSAPLSSLYEELAIHHGYQPQHIRLWSWSYHYPKDKISLRPSTALPPYSPDDSTPFDIVLGKALGMDEATTRQRYENKPMAAFLYVEQRREIVPPTSGNIVSAVSEWIDMTEASTAFNPALVQHGTRPPQSHECYGAGYFRYLPRQPSISFTTYLKKPCYITDTSFTLLLPNKTHSFVAYAELYASKDDIGKRSVDMPPDARVRAANPPQDMPADSKQCQCSHTFPMTKSGLPFLATAIRFVVMFQDPYVGSPGICITRIQTPSCMVDPLYAAVLKDVSALPKEAIAKEAAANTTATLSSEKRGSLSARFAAQRSLMPTKGAHALDALSVSYAANASIPAYNQDTDVLLMIKQYSPSGGSHAGEPVRFLGPLVVKKSMCLQDYQSAILRMMGMPAERLVAPRMRRHLVKMRADASSSSSTNLVLSDAAWQHCYEPSLLFYDESQTNQVATLDIDRPIATQELVSGNVIIVQLDVPSVASIYRFPTAIGYYTNINTRHMVTIRFHDNPEDPVIQLPMNSSWSYVEVCDFITLKLNHLLLLEEGAEVANSSPTSAAHSPASPNSSVQLSSRRKKREQHHRDEKHLLLQGENDDSSLFHSDYIRLYSTANIITPVPAPDPIRSLTKGTSSLYDYLDVNDSLAQDLFIEVLSVPRTVLETFTPVTLTPVDEFGCPYLGGGESIAGTTSSASAPTKAEGGPSSSADPAASSTPAPTRSVEDAVSKAAAKEEVPMLLPPGSTFRDIVKQCFIQAGLLKEEEGADGIITTAIEGFHLAPHYTIVGVLRDEPSRPVIVHDHIFMDPSLPSAIPPTDLFSRQFRFVLMATEPLPGYDPVKQGPKWDYSHFMDKPDARKYIRIMCSHTDIVDVAYYRKAKLWGTPFLVTASFATSTDDCMKIMCDVARVQMDTLVSGSSKNLAVLLYTNMALHFNECIPVVQYLKHTRQADLPSILVLNHKRPKKAMMATTGHREASLVLERKAPK